jgi:hypothetical protein
MTRLRLDINFDEQRLLAANKDRAVANRAALPERKQRRQVANDKTTPAPAPDGTPATPAAEEEPRGGTPDLYTRDKPGAQRRKKKELRVFGMEGLNNFPAYGTRETFSQAWTAYTEKVLIDRNNLSDDLGDHTLVSYEIVPRTRSNSYDIADIQWRPFFVEELKSGRKYAMPAPHTVEDCIISADWTLRQRAPGLPDYSQTINIPPTTASPPELPFLFEDKQAISDLTSEYALHASDGTTIHYSTMVRVATPGPAFLNQVFGLYDIYDPRGWGRTESVIDDAPAQEQRTRRVVISEFGGNGINQPDQYIDNFYKYYGLYWTYTPDTDVTTIRVVLLLSSFSYRQNLDLNFDQVAPAYLNNQDPGSPHYQLWLEAKNKSSFSESFVARDWLFQNFGIIYPNKNTWRPGLVYYKETGLLVMTTRTAGTDDYRIFTRTVDPDLAYSSAVIYLPLGYDPFLTTDQNFVNAGWALDRVITTPFSNDLLNYVAHRP